MDFVYDSDLASLETLAKDIQSFGEKEKLHKDLIYAINLCLDELVTNIISYGYRDGSKQPIRVILKKNGGQVMIVIKDKGIPFNPTERLNETPDTQSSIEERNVGGLGVFFVKKYMDSVQYKREGDENELTLVTKAY